MVNLVVDEGIIVADDIWMIKRGQKMHLQTSNKNNGFK